MSALIKLVRKLDQDGIDALGETFQQLWQNLAASSAGQFHAAEQSALRWLLKTMHGSSEAAELTRRDPLVWAILRCVFQRIPLFSLAKSLADRKFIAVLQKTIAEISNPSTESALNDTAKRKRSSTTPLTLEGAKSLEGCLRTCKALFTCLRALLERIDDTPSSSHDKIGAEHIRSLFCNTAADTASLIAPLFGLCNELLQSSLMAEFEELDDCFQTLNLIWDLRLQSSDDALEVALHIFNPAVSILNQLDSWAPSEDLLPEPLRNRWSSDLRSFLQRSFVLPARAVFISRQDFEPVIRAIGVSSGHLDISAPILYALTSASSGLADGSDQRKGESEWMRRIFQEVREASHKRSDRNEILGNILQQAFRQHMPVGVEELRLVCDTYALSNDNTDWDLVAKASFCDPGIFQSSGPGRLLLNEVCRRSVSPGVSADEHKAISDVAHAILQNFRTARDVGSFLRLWFDQLCIEEGRNALSSSPWLHIATKKEDHEPLQNFLETDLSPTQILEVLNQISTQDTTPQAICVLTAVIAEGIRSESFVDVVGHKMYDLVLPIKDTSSSPLTAMKWRVVSKAISSFPGSERPGIWTSVRDRLSKILKKGSIESRETFEAFECCCEAWVAMSPDDEEISGLVKMIERFLTRLAAQFQTTPVALTHLAQRSDTRVEVLAAGEVKPEQYLSWFLLDSSRINRLISSRVDQLPEMILEALASRTASPANLRNLWDALLQNDNNLNSAQLAGHLLKRIMACLDQLDEEKHWPGARGEVYLRELASIPVDAFSRQQREHIMLTLERQKAKMFKSKKGSADSWKQVISLETKMMSRPTFYENMSFQNLSDMAERFSNMPAKSTFDDAGLLELLERFNLLSSYTIRQMTDHIEDRSMQYLTESANFVTECESALLTGGNNGAQQTLPLYITLLKTLAIELRQSPNCLQTEKLKALAEQTEAVLAKCILSVVRYVVMDESLFAQHGSVKDLRLFAAIDAAGSIQDLDLVSSCEKSSLKALEGKSFEAMQQGDLKGWKIMIFLIQHLGQQRGGTQPERFESLNRIHEKLRAPLMQECIASLFKDRDTVSQLDYLQILIQNYRETYDADGQLVAIQSAVEQLIGKSGIVDPRILMTILTLIRFA